MGGKWPSTCDCCGAVCPEADFAIWIANDNQQRDDHFNIYIDGVLIRDVANNPIVLLLGQDTYSGHLILPGSYSAAGFGDINWVYPGAPSAAQTAWSNGTDPDRRLIFSNNLPAVLESSSYNIEFRNVQNNNNGNFGVLNFYQPCPGPSGTDEVDIRFLIGNDTYSGPSGADLFFTVNTGACNTCP